MKNLKRFNILDIRKQNKCPYDVIEEWLNVNSNCCDDRLVTFSDPDGTIHTHFFQQEADEWMSCHDDYIEDQEYIDIIGICRLWNVVVLGNEEEIDCRVSDAYTIPDEVM